MNVSGSYLIPSPRLGVWTLLHDPDVLRRAVPGCQSFEASGEPGAYAATMAVGVGPIRGRFAGKVTLADVRDGEAYAMTLQGQGPTGFVSGTGNVLLSDEGAGTRVTVQGDAQIGGTLAQVGSRMIETAVRVLMGQFFTAISDEALREATDKS
ncbi:MAG: carbon monoxide dehydrogenase subunit G [Chloroflexi bacterium]|nr:carbon monoxide dehydrogenase subunit G [Chloroflexota bacterium]